ncbi:MAG: hypothetical protein KQI81_16630, partial [Deltaproteobacteria bacterium]|nr:hypothetical protein [Deltaproteobacteria bacterium]
FGLIDIAVNIFSDEILEQFSSAKIMPGGEFRTADPTRFEEETLAGRVELGNVSRDTGHLHRYIAVYGHWLDFVIDFNLFRRIDQKTHPVFVDIENAVGFSVYGYGQILDGKSAFLPVPQNLIHTFLLLSLNLTCVFSGQSIGMMFNDIFIVSDQAAFPIS